jgi:hypothetical protein
MFTKQGVSFLFRKKLFFQFFLIVFLLFVVSFGYCGANAEQNVFQNSDFAEPILSQSVAEVRPEETEIIEEHEPAPIVPSVPSRAEEVMKAVSNAYFPRITGPAVFQNDDWAVTIRGELFYYAEGRMLPEHLKDNYAEYDAQPFYRYPKELPPWESASEEESASRKASQNRREENPPKRAPFFFDALYRARSANESYDRVKTLKFLGKDVMVHYTILEQLALVEEAINHAAQNNAAVRTWIANISTITGWNWRTIADTQSRSFHSYGTAIDIQPTSAKGLATYWLWTSEWTDEWWNVPYSQRLHPPEEVIQSFEKYGFTWGGKWALFDTMHFEYRPEIFMLSGIAQTDLKTLR